MANKPLSFEQLLELQESERLEIVWKISRFIDKLQNPNDVEITLSYKGEIIFQREVQEGVAIEKKVSFYKRNIENKPN